MKKDTWYKRLGWFFLFSLITLGLFYALELVFTKFMNAYEANDYEASFTDNTYIIGNMLYVEIETDAEKYYYDLWIDDVNLNVKVENETTYSFDLTDIVDLSKGTHVIKSSFFGKNGISKYRETLISYVLEVK
mgnify:CR=1 FL=1